MKNIKLILIIFLQVGMIQMVSAQSTKEVKLNNGRTGNIIPSKEKVTESPINRSVDTYRGSDQDNGGKGNANDENQTDWTMPIDLDLLKDMIESGTGGTDSEVAANMQKMDAQISQILAENQQLKIEMKNLLDKIEACCNAADPKSGDTKGKSFVLQSIPNPTTTSALVTYYIPGIYDSAAIRVVDLAGQLLDTYPITDVGTGELTINTENFAAGTYIYTLIIDGQSIESKLMNVAK
jgi:hypothetical protein